MEIGTEYRNRNRNRISEPKIGTENRNRKSEPKIGTETKLNKQTKQKRRPKHFFHHFIIMTYLLNVGSIGRHKTLCQPKNIDFSR